MRRARWIAVSVAAVSILVLAGVSRAQPPTPTPGTQPAPVPVPPTTPTGPVPSPPAKEEEREPVPVPETAAEPSRVPEDLLQTLTPTFVGPDLFNPPAHQGWLSLTPSFTLSGEYNDNVFLSSRNRETDGIVGLTPGLTVSIRKPGFSLFSGYNTTGQIFVRNSDLNDFGKQQQFVASLRYAVTPGVTFGLTDTFVLGRDTTSLTSGGVSVGFRDSWRNTLTPRLEWQATPSTGFRLLASHTIIRFTEGDDSSDSDTYRVVLSMDHRLTARLVGTLGASVAYIDEKDEESRWTYSPSAGLSYDITPTLRASVRGGPLISQRDGDTSVTPSVGALVDQRFKFGTVQVGYDRAIAAETIGTRDRQVIFGSVFVPTLTRGLQLGFTPRYAIIERDRDIPSRDQTVKTLTLNLRAAYKVARSISLIGAYTFFQQTTDRSRDDIDVDQNRVFLGVQYAFPINFY